MSAEACFTHSSSSLTATVVQTWIPLALQHPHSDAPVHTRARRTPRDQLPWQSIHQVYHRHFLPRCLRPVLAQGSAAPLQAVSRRIKVSAAGSVRGYLLQSWWRKRRATPTRGTASKEPWLRALQQGGGAELPLGSQGGLWGINALSVTSSTDCPPCTGHPAPPALAPCVPFAFGHPWEHPWPHLGNTQPAAPLPKNPSTSWARNLFSRIPPWMRDPAPDFCIHHGL